MKTSRTIIVVLVPLLILVTGCSLWPTGPNRLFTGTFGADNAADFHTFEGAVTTTCRDVRARVGEGPEIVVGCVAGVTPQGGVERQVFCPKPALYDECRSAEVASRVSLRVTPFGEPTRWLVEQINLGR